MTGWRRFGAWALLMLGLSSMVGDAVGFVPLKAVGAASMIAPLPKVFSDVDGFETFAASFTLRWRDGDGVASETALTPEIYRQVGGPYNRRNVYGAALSYAPRMPEPLWTAVYCYGLAPGGAVREELGIPADARSVEIEIRSRTAGRPDVWRLAPECAR